MSKRSKGIFCILLLVIPMLTACSSMQKEVKIGVSFGAGPAVRWDSEKVYMEEMAEELGVEIEVRVNRNEEEKSQRQDCTEMIDSGIDVLILMPRDAGNAGEIIAYAKSKKVPVISYARMVIGEQVDLFVGYDSNLIGQKMGQYLTEAVYEGDYILLRGDENDNNAVVQHKGSMKYIDSVKGSIQIILDAAVPGWSPEEAEKMVLEAVAANGNQIDAILAPNDMIAGGCAEALRKLGVTQHVVITGVDAELDAVRRIAEGTQDSTIYLDLRELARIAVEEAVHIARGEKLNANTEMDNRSDRPVKARLITGQLVIRENLDKVLIDSGYYTREQVYGE